MPAFEQMIDSVIEGDCLSVMDEISNKSIDMILSDLPYGTTANPWDEVIDFEKLWNHYKRIIKPDGVIALTAAGLFTGKVILSNPEWFKYKIVWIKSKSTNFLNAKKQPLRRHEDICIFYAKQPTYQPQMTMGKPYDRGWKKPHFTGVYGCYNSSYGKSDGQRYPYDIIMFDEDSADDWFYSKTSEQEKDSPLHPTQKPVDLGRYLIRTLPTLVT